MANYKKLRRTKKKDRPAGRSAARSHPKGAVHAARGRTRTARPFVPVGNFPTKDAAASAAEQYTGTGSKMMPNIFVPTAVKGGFAIVRVR